MAQEPVLNSPLRTLVDGNMDVFRYGLFKYDESQFEDPTYLGFTVEIDEQSALFTLVRPFLEKNGAGRSELASRIPVYDEFVSKIVSVFKSQESVVDPTREKGLYIKQHYINSIKGFQHLTQKFNKWREDKLEVELYEDMTMYSSYIAHLYNNLIYSYENGRALIPENLLKFNLKIKISEIRNLTSIAKLKSTDPVDKRIVDGLKNNITCLVYTLYDCEFDFFGSKPIEDSIVQAGIDATTPGHSILGFNIFFKSVARNIFNPLISNALAMNDNSTDLGVVLLNTNGNSNPNGQVTNASGVSVGVNGEAYQSYTVDGKTIHVASFQNDERKPSSLGTYAAETTGHPELKTTSDLMARQQQIQDIVDYNAPLMPDPRDLQTTEFDPLSPGSDDTLMDKIVGRDLVNIVNDPTKALNNLTNKIANKVTNSLKDELHMAVQRLKMKRNELVKSFITDVENNFHMRRIVPDNVYTQPDYYKNALEQLKSDIGLTIGDSLVSVLTHN